MIAKRIKIESEGFDGQGSTEYIRGGRDEDKNARSVTIEKNYKGKDIKVSRRNKKDGSVKVKTKEMLRESLQTDTNETPSPLLDEKNILDS